MSDLRRREIRGHGATRDDAAGFDAWSIVEDSKQTGAVMFSLVMTWIGTIIGLLVLAVMVVAGVLADSEQN